LERKLHACLRGCRFQDGPHDHRELATKSKRKDRYVRSEFRDNP
jgi:hypothetical protein